MVVLFIAVVAGLITGVWSQRIGIATRIVNRALVRYELQNLTFRISRLEFNRVVIEDIVIQPDDPLLEVGAVECFFTWSGLKQGNVSRLNISRVETHIVADDQGVITYPCYAYFMRNPKLQAVCSASSDTPKRSEGTPFSIGSVILNKSCISVEDKDGKVMAALELDGGLTWHDNDNYRFWLTCQEEQFLNGKIDGSFSLAAGCVESSLDLRVANLPALTQLLAVVMPTATWSEQVEFDRAATLMLRGNLELEAWNKLKYFNLQVSASRNSTFALPVQQCRVQLQNARVNLNGNGIDDVQATLNLGVSALQLGERTYAQHKGGRLLGIRGETHFQQTKERSITASMVADLPGRSFADILPQVLPMTRFFFSDGGSVALSAELSSPLEESAWHGDIHLQAEALRSAAPLPGGRGRVGCSSLTVTGRLDVAESIAGKAELDFALSDFYLMRRGLHLRGDAGLHLDLQPPYQGAVGTFSGNIMETTATRQMGIKFADNRLPFAGGVVVSNLAANPVWELQLQSSDNQLALTVPDGEFGSIVGAELALRYADPILELNGSGWLQNGRLIQDQTNTTTGVEAGIAELKTTFSLPACDPGKPEDIRLNTAVKWHGGWLTAETLATRLTGLEGNIAFAWTPEQGVDFTTPPVIAWQQLESQGIAMQPHNFNLQLSNENLIASGEIELEGCNNRIQLQADVPQLEFNHVAVKIALPATTFASEGIIDNLAQHYLPGLSVVGTIALDSELRFLGSQPYFVGHLQGNNCQIAYKEIGVEGMEVDLKFEHGVTFRTIGRPFVTFNKAKVDRFNLDSGRVDFQLTPEELYIDRIEVGWCKGALNAYSLHLDFDNPQCHSVIYADRIDVGEVLATTLALQGEMEGYLYGRFPVGIENKRIKLYNGFLYSLPGQSGKLRLDDSKQMITLLDKAGIKGDVQEPLSRALADLDFNSVSLDLDVMDNGAGALRIKIKGKSNYSEWPAPVDLNLNLHGPMEELLNMGLDMSLKK